MCDAKDNDCNEGIDEPSAEDANTYFADVDNDTYGDFDNQIRACSVPAGYTTDNTDCDDSTNTVSPGATEVCDLLDNDCDGQHYVGGRQSLADAPFELIGPSAFSGAGRTVAAIADWNADGRDEVLVGSPEDDTTASDAGAVFGWNATGHGGTYDFSALNALDEPFHSFRIYGIAPNDNVGSAVASGDVNGDGTADVVIGTENYANGTGLISIFYGPVTGDHLITDADVAVNGATDSHAGKSIAIINLNGDAFDDVVWGSPEHDVTGTNEGMVEILMGSGSLSATETSDFVINGTDDFAQVGYQVVNLGDVDGDNNLDLGIGAPDHPAANGSGEFYVFYGSGFPFTTPTTVASADVTWGGVSFLTHLGRSVAGVGDVNGDTFDDILFGSLQRRAYLVYGSATLANEDIDDAASMVFIGDNSSGAAQVVGAPGDMDGDGFAEIIVGAFEDDDGGLNAGAVHIIYGRASFPGEGSPPPEFDINDIESQGRFPAGPPALPPISYVNSPGFIEGAKLTGEDDDDFSGQAFAFGDFNGDGQADLLVGAPHADGPAGTYAGKVYGYFGGEYGVDIDAVDASDWYTDNDQDNWGVSPLSLFDTCPMHVPYANGLPMFSLQIEDCDDNDASVFPGATETDFDLVDQDCDTFDNNVHRATPVIDGDASEWTGDEQMPTAEGSIWITWDNNNLYIAALHPDVTAGGANHHLLIYVGADLVGTSTGRAYGAQQPLMAFEPSNLFEWNADNTTSQYEWNDGGGSWTAEAPTYTHVEDEANNTVEFSIPFTEIAMTDTFRVHVAWVDESGPETSYGASPTGSFANGATDPDYLQYHEFQFTQPGDPLSFPEITMPDGTTLFKDDLIITEVMAVASDCPDVDSEYFEVYNNSGAAVNLKNVTIEGTTGSETVAVDTVIADEGYAVMYRAPDTTQCYSFAGDFAYNAAIDMANRGDQLILRNGAIDIDRLEFHPSAITPGVAIELDPTQVTVGNDDPYYWCDALLLIPSATADLGSPGQANASCGGAPSGDADSLIAGDLVITELMINPDDCGDSQAEWIEFENQSGAKLDLQNLVISSNSGSYTITGSKFVAKGQRVLAYRNSGGQCYGMNEDVFYGANIGMNNTSDTIELENTTGIIDQVDYDGWVLPAAGRSLQLSINDLDATSNDSPGSWCPSNNTFPGAGSDLGSPKMYNFPCQTGIEDLTLGDIVISEVMFDPQDCADSDGEYVEIYNASGGPIDLYGLQMTFGFQWWGMNESYIVSAGQYALLGRTDLSACHSVVPDVVYAGTMDLPLNGARISVGNSSGTLDVLDFTGATGFNPPGVPIEVNNDYLDVVNNDDPLRWCEGRDVITGGSTDVGSPGATNRATWRNTITVDGNLADWINADEQFTTSSGDKAYITWDAANIYIAVDHPDIATGGSQHWLAVYFSNKSGYLNPIGVPIGSQTPNHFMEADFFLGYKLDDSFDKLSEWTGSSWSDTPNFLGTAGSAIAESGNVVEIQIPRSVLGLTDVMGINMALVYEGAPTELTYSALPVITFEPDASTDPDWDQFFGYRLENCYEPTWARPTPYLNRQITIDGSMAGWQTDECFDVASGGGNQVCVTWDMTHIYVAADHSLVNDQAGDLWTVYLQGNGTNTASTGVPNGVQVPNLPQPMEYAIDYLIQAAEVPELVTSVSADFDTNDATYFTTGPGDWARTGRVLELKFPNNLLVSGPPGPFAFTSAFADETTPGSETSEDPLPVESFGGPVLDPDYDAYLMFDFSSPVLPIDAKVGP